MTNDCLMYSCNWEVSCVCMKMCSELFINNFILNSKWLIILQEIHRVSQLHVVVHSAEGGGQSEAAVTSLGHIV